MITKKFKSNMLFITTSPFYDEKGSSLRSYSILKKLSFKFKIDVVTYSLGRNPPGIKNITLSRTPSFFKPRLKPNIISFGKIILDVLIFYKICILLVKNKYDVIHCEDFEASLIIYICSKLFLTKKSKIVYSIHNRINDNIKLNNFKFFTKISNISNYFEKKIIANSNLIILNWKKYQTHKVFTSKRTIMLYDPIKLDISTLKNNNENYLVYCGNFEDYQKIDFFLKAFHKSKCKFKLYLIGDVSFKIKQLIKILNLQDRVLLLGKLSVEDTNFYIYNSVAGILPRESGSSMKVIHYLVFNKPVIAKNSPSNRELLSHLENALLYNSFEELTQILNQINFKLIKELEKNTINTKKLFLDNWDDKEFLKKYLNNLI